MQKLKGFNTTWILAAGLCLFAVGVAWIGAWEAIQKRHDPPGWIIDRATPYLPQVIGWSGMVLIAVAIVLYMVAGIARLFRRRI